MNPTIIAHSQKPQYFNLVSSSVAIKRLCDAVRTRHALITTISTFTRWHVHYAADDALWF